MKIATLTAPEGVHLDAVPADAIEPAKGHANALFYGQFHRLAPEVRSAFQERAELAQRFKQRTDPEACDEAWRKVDKLRRDASRLLLYREAPTLLAFQATSDSTVAMTFGLPGIPDSDQQHTFLISVGMRYYCDPEPAFSERILLKLANLPWISTFSGQARNACRWIVFDHRWDHDIGDACEWAVESLDLPPGPALPPQLTAGDTEGFFDSFEEELDQASALMDEQQTEIRARGPGEYFVE